MLSKMQLHDGYQIPPPFLFWGCNHAVLRSFFGAESTIMISAKTVSFARWCQRSLQSLCVCGDSRVRNECYVGLCYIWHVLRAVQAKPCPVTASDKRAAMADLHLNGKFRSEEHKQV